MATLTQDEVTTAQASGAFLSLYDFAIAGCVAKDARKTSAALVELIAALDFNYEDIAGGFYRLYEYCLREVKAGRFDGAQKILTELRATWQIALSATPELTDG